MTNATTEATTGRRLLAGEPLRECGSLLQVTLGGWFTLRRTGSPVILTAEHVLTPDSLRALPAAPRRPWHAPGTVDRTTEERRLCHGDGSPVARVLASWERGAHGEAAELDACIAEPFALSDATFDIPTLPWRPGIAAPVPGAPVAKFTRGAGLRYGRILAIGRVPHRSSTVHDVVIAAEDGQPFAIAGDSGALVVDLHTRSIVAMHVGEMLNVETAGRRWPVLWRAQTIGAILSAFDLETGSLLSAS